jgi:hypothetical protein
MPSVTSVTPTPDASIPAANFKHEYQCTYTA